MTITSLPREAEQTLPETHTNNRKQLNTHETNTRHHNDPTFLTPLVTGPGMPGHADPFPGFRPGLRRNPALFELYRHTSGEQHPREGRIDAQRQLPVF